MSNFVVIDGNSLMHRAFHALPPMNNNQGVPTQAIYGFLSMLLKVIETQKPSHLLVAFDSRAPTPRHIVYEAYKAGRKPMEDELRVQFPLIREVLQAMKIAIIQQDGYEADDFLGIFSRRAELQGLDACLVTGDRDALQLVSEKTTVLLTRKGISETQSVTPAALWDMYEVKPEQMIEIKGLMGDASDNIPGIPGVGEKTALKLIHEYGNVENVIAHANEVKGAKLQEKINTFADQARMSREIGIICTDVDAPIELQTQDCVFEATKMQQGKTALFELGLRNIVTRIGQIAPQTEQNEIISNQPKIDVIEIEEEKILDQAIEKWRKETRLSIVWQDHFSVSDGETSWIIHTQQTLLQQGLDPMMLLRKMQPIFESEKIEKIIFDVKSLKHELNQYQISLSRSTQDVMLCAYLLQPSMTQLSPANLAKESLGIEEYHAGVLWQLYLDTQERLKAQQMWELFEKIEMPLVYVLFDMERIGFLIDKDVLKALGTSYQTEIDSLKTEILDMAGEDFNILSPKQLGAILFDKLGLPARRKTKTGYSTDADTLDTLLDLHPIVQKVLDYRQFNKLKSTYIDGLLTAADSKGRVHSVFKQNVTATGRISSTEPNLQNIPIRTQLGREIRKAFIAPEGNVLVGADYSQIELRVLAHIAQDEVMLDSFAKGEDIHARTAAEVAKCAISEVTPQMRSAAKAVNFGIVYGISDFGLARQLGISRKEAEKYIQSYLETYQGIARYMKEIVEKGKEQGYVQTLYGRRRNLPELKASNHNTRMFGERVAMNAPIQGTAADIIKVAMIRVAQELEKERLKSRLILQVHDELIVETPEEERQEVEKLLQACMEQVIELRAPLIAEVHSGSSWFDT